MKALPVDVRLPLTWIMGMYAPDARPDFITVKLGLSGMEIDDAPYGPDWGRPGETMLGFARYQDKPKTKNKYPY